MKQNNNPVQIIVKRAKSTVYLRIAGSLVLCNTLTLISMLVITIPEIALIIWYSNFIFCFLAILTIFTKWYFLEYRIKPHFIEKRFGVFIKRVISYDLKLTQEIQLKKGIIGKIFNFGNISLYNPTVQNDFDLLYVSNPEKVVSYIKRNIRHLESRTKKNAYVFKK